MEEDSFEDDYEYEYSDEDNEEYKYSDEEDNVDYNSDDSADMSMEFADGGNAQDSFESVKGKKRLSSSSSYKKSDEIRRNSDNNPNAAPVRIISTNKSSNDLELTTSTGTGIRMLDSNDLVPIMKHKIADVTSVLEVPTSAAAILLREHKWVKERVFESFFSEESEKVRKKCGVRSRCENIANPKACKPCDGERNRECQICTDDGFSASDMLSMPCGHEFCRDCWGQFVGIMIQDGPSCIRTTCPQASCHETVTEIEVAAVRPDLLPKFESYQLRSFVEINGMARWCPGPGCSRIAMEMDGSVAGDFSRVASCDECDTRFCIKCGEEPHAPVTCKELARWNEKCRNESETANWILANTKACPKCSSRIEKNQGCNHMNCQQCKYEFCWICLRPWSEHGANTGGYYKCNKFDANDGGNDQSDAAKAKRELDRYLHYYKRYHAHSEAQKFARNQLRETEKRMVTLQESTSDHSTWTDVEFLKAAVEQLIECRRVLKYTYTFAYYLTDKSKEMQKERFEYHQEMLEKFTENLSGLSEKPLAEMDRTNVVNQTRVVHLFMKNILKYVEDGMEEH